jgi:uncharacterized membrane protein
MKLRTPDSTKESYFLQALALVLAAVIASMFLTPKLPAMVGVHWDIFGRQDQEAPRIWAALAIPMVMIVQALSAGLSLNVPRANTVYRRRSISIMVALLVAHLFFLKTVAGWRPTEPFFFCAALGLLMIVFGLTFPSLKPNGLYGVRTKWTVDNRNVWDETHRVAARVYLVTGISCILAALLFDPSLISLVSILAVLFSSLFPYDYSRRVAMRSSETVAQG